MYTNCKHTFILKLYSAFFSLSNSLMILIDPLFLLIANWSLLVEPPVTNLKLKIFYLKTSRILWLKNIVLFFFFCQLRRQFSLVIKMDIHLVYNANIIVVNWVMILIKFRNTKPYHFKICLFLYLPSLPSPDPDENPLYRKKTYKIISTLGWE